jgi:hypothetical protein
MIHVNKKIHHKENLAKQIAQIISNVTELEHKNLIKLTSDTVYLYPQIWKTKMAAINWINCLYHYYVVKKQLKSKSPLYFRAMENEELIGSIVNKKASVLIF